MEKYHLPPVKTGDGLESMPSLSVPCHLEDSVPLKRAKTFHPHPSLEHLTLRQKGARTGDRGYGRRSMILKGTGEFMCKGSDPLPYLYTEKTGGI